MTRSTPEFASICCVRLFARAATWLALTRCTTDTQYVRQSIAPYGAPHLQLSLFLNIGHTPDGQAHLIHSTLSRCEPVQWSIAPGEGRPETLCCAAASHTQHSKHEELEHRPVRAFGESWLHSRIRQ